jgi:glycosyltransferase involved in cell wall biosynthesis
MIFEENEMNGYFQEGYILVTPCKNEEESLPNLIHSMIVHSIKPVLWVIVDDGSTDGTVEIIAEAEERYGWIKGVYLKEKEDYDVGTHLAVVYNIGFEFAKDYCSENNINYEYVALIDADNIPEKDYFKKLIGEFKNNVKLGIASGNSAYVDIEKFRDISGDETEDIFVLYKNCVTEIQTGREDLPMGSARMWRRGCFEAMGGGYPIAKAPDNVANAKAKLRGWDTKRFFDIKVIERRGQLKPGLWAGYSQVGESNYYRGFSFQIAVLKALNYSVKSPYYIGIAYLWGYIKAFIYRKERINDDEILKYYRYERPKELKAYYKEKIKRLLRKFYRRDHGER